MIKNIQCDPDVHPDVAGTGENRSFKRSASVLYLKSLRNKKITCRFYILTGRTGWHLAVVALDGVFPLVFISGFNKTFSSQPSCHISHL